MSFFEKLNFSSANEDGETERAALDGARRIVCLTGSGTRPLDLLTSDAVEVIALDINPAQCATLHLKVAAMQQLGRDDYLAFLGIGGKAGPRYRDLRSLLPAEARNYWDHHEKTVDSGIWYAGKWEKLLAWNALFLELFRGRALDEVLAAPDVATQAEIWQRRFDDSGLRKTAELIGRQWVWKWVMREPAGEFLPGPAEVSERLAQSFKRAASTFLFRDSDFAMLALRGKMQRDGALPVHLRAEHYETVRARLPHLKVMQGGLDGLATSGLADVDGFSLSDFGSYCGRDIYAACWNGVRAVAAPGAKFCERIFMNTMPLPFPDLVEDVDLSRQLTARDKAIIYDVRAGRVRMA